jgi:elongation factor P--(R)-beta-lysine ligase
VSPTRPQRPGARSTPLPAAGVPVERRLATELRRDSPEPAVEVGGRVVLALPDGVRIEHGGAALALRSTQRPELGAWVLARGDWDGEQLRVEALQVVQPPQRAFGAADSEWAFGRRGVAMLAQRHGLQRAIRGYFDARGFVEVETPALVSAPALELHVSALEVHGAGAPRWLHTSPELHMKRLLCAGMPRIYQLCKTYRRDELGALHEPEFTMLEWYRAFAGSEAVMQDTEQLVAAGALALHGTTQVPRAAGGVLDVAPPWPRLTVREAFSRYAGLDVDAVLPDEDAFFRVLAERIEPQLGRGKPLFLTHFPASMAALARLRDDDPRSADRFEAYANGVELCNGFGELTDPVEQRRRFEADRAARARRGLPVYPLAERFLTALEEGMPPSGGNALGFDRLAMLLLGAERIEDVIAFGSNRS